MNRAQELTARGIDVVDFGPGEPDFSDAGAGGAAGIRAIEQGYTKYTNALGTKALRDAIAGRYNRRYGPTSARACHRRHRRQAGAVSNLMMAMVDAGDEVIIPAPYWVSFPTRSSFAGGKPVFAPTARRTASVRRSPPSSLWPASALVASSSTRRTTPPARSSKSGNWGNRRVVRGSRGLPHFRRDYEPSLRRPHPHLGHPLVRGVIPRPWRW